MKKITLFALALLMFAPALAETFTVDVELLGNSTTYEINAGDVMVLLWNTQTVTITAKQTPFDMTELLASGESYINPDLNFTVTCSKCPNQTIIFPPCPNVTLSCPELPEGFGDIIDYNMTKQNNTWLWEKYLEAKMQLNGSEIAKENLMQQKMHLENIQLPQAKEDGILEGVNQANQGWVWLLILEGIIVMVVLILLFLFFKFRWWETLTKHTTFVDLFADGHRMRTMKYDQELDKKSDILTIGDERINQDNSDWLESITPKHRLVIKTDKGQLAEKFNLKHIESERKIVEKDRVIKEQDLEIKDMKEKIARVLDVPEVTSDSKKARKND